MNMTSGNLENRLRAAVGDSIIGLDPVIRALTIAALARGHVLLQGPPGLGKTMLSMQFAKALGGKFKRVQGTADLMPSDITGVHVFDSIKNEFVFRPGPLFADVLLIDEINRTGPRTQSALLEAMQERQVTIDRSQYALAADFLVIATQNPKEFEGTYPLPESQLDRFMLRVDIGYPSRDDERSILARHGQVEPAALSQEAESVGREAIVAARAAADTIHLAPELSEYVLDIAKASRQNSHLTLGLSTRGAIALLRASRVAAALRGADFVAPDDVKEMAPLVIPHRLVLSPEALLEGVTEQSILIRLLDQVPVPR